MDDPAPVRRRIPRWLLAIPIVGALLVMGVIAVAPVMLSCGGGGVHVPPTPPPADDTIATQ